MPAFPTNSLIFFPCACWSEGCFFGHWRSDVTFPLIAGGATRRAVRKHRAPNGALRRVGEWGGARVLAVVRKHRAPNGALRRERQPVPGVGDVVSESTERQTVH
mgnify:CR=1 FL=1